MKAVLLSLGVLACGVVGLVVAPAALANGEGGHLGLYLEAIPTAEGGTALRVQSLEEDGPAAKAGVLQGDILVSAAGESVDTIDTLRGILKSRTPGASVELGVLRGDESFKLDVTLGEPPAAAPEPATPSAPPASGGTAFLGVGLLPVHPAVAAHLGLELNAGVSIGDVREGSPAAQAGLQVHDVIVSVQGAAVQGPKHFVELLSARRPGDDVSLGVIHQGARETVETTLAERPNDLPAVGTSPASPFGAPWGPQVGKSGTIIIQGPNGKERSFALPRGAWDMDEMLKDMEKRFGEFGFPQPTPDQLSEHLRKLLETYRSGAKEPGLSEDARTSSSQSAVVRVVEGDLDITVRDQDGRRTVDVKRGDEVLAEGLPYDKIDTLEESVRQKVEQVASGIHVESTPSKPLPKLDPPPKSSELKA